jgi:hypothetical protein
VRRQRSSSSRDGTPRDVWYATVLVSRTGTPGCAATRYVVFARSSPVTTRLVNSFSVTMSWSAITPSVMPLSAHRKPSATRPVSLSPSFVCGSSTRRVSCSALRGSLPSPMALCRTWYSSSPS